MFSYPGRPLGLSGVIPSAGGVPRGNPRRPAKKRRTPGAYGGTGLAASMDWKVVCSTGSLFKIPSARSLHSSVQER